MRSFLKCLIFTCGGQIILLCNVFSFYYNNGILITMPISLFYLPILTLTPTSDFSFRSASFRSPFPFFLKNGTKRFYRFEQERNGTMKFAGAIKQAVSFQNHKKNSWKSLKIGKNPKNFRLWRLPAPQPQATHLL